MEEDMEALQINKGLELDELPVIESLSAVDG